jgi:hypothetical protein
LSSGAERQALLEILALRIAAKSHIVDKVITGRLSLVQAAALFGALNRLPPQSLKASPSDLSAFHRFPAHTDEERLCQQVVQWVGAELAHDEDRREATLVCLEAEFKEGRKEGTVQLPDLLTLVSVQKLLEQVRKQPTDPVRTVSIPSMAPTHPLRSGEPHAEQFQQ